MKAGKGYYRKYKDKQDLYTDVNRVWSGRTSDSAMLVARKKKRIYLELSERTRSFEERRETEKTIRCLASRSIIVPLRRAMLGFLAVPP